MLVKRGKICFGSQSGGKPYSTLWSKAEDGAPCGGGDVAQLAHISANQNTESSEQKHRWSVALKISNDMSPWSYLPAGPHVQMMLQPPRTASPAGKQVFNISLWATSHVQTIVKTGTKEVHETDVWRTSESEEWRLKSTCMSAFKITTKGDFQTT